MITIKEETAPDFQSIGRLIEAAFHSEEHSDHREHLLVERLRMTPAYIPSLALTAHTSEGELAGYIMLSRLTIEDGHSTLALAPVAVLPGFQGMGIGSMLITEAHRRAAGQGYGSIVVLGHKDYYPRFGYRPLSQFGLRMPFDAPQEYCMATELRAGALDGIGGMINYPEVFFQ